MSRINGVSDEEASFIQRRVFRTAEKMSGAVPEPLRLYAKSNPVLWAAGAFEMANGRASRVDQKLKDLASLKAASMIGCLF